MIIIVINKYCWVVKETNYHIICIFIQLFLTKNVIWFVLLLTEMGKNNRRIKY